MTKDINRAKAKRQIGSLYRRAAGVALDVCAYCGDERDVLDHCPPLSIAVDLDLKKFFEKGGELLLYPSCNHCNTLLGNKQLASFEERVVFLYEAYNVKIDKEDRLWTEDEIEELGYNLRVMASKRAARVALLIRKQRGVEATLCNIERATQS